MDPLPSELEERVQAELRPGERLIWAGQPRPGRLMKTAVPVVLFGIPFTAFAIFWVVAASGILFANALGGGPGDVFSCFPLFGVPFILVGLAMLSSPYWMYQSALRTCYAVTSERVIVWRASGFGGVEVRSFGGPDLTKMVRRDFPDGSGDLIFQEYLTATTDGRGFARTQRNEIGFLGVENVREVEGLIRKTLLPSS